MTVSSFFPGHIRLRGEMIKDKDIFEAFKKRIKSSFSCDFEVPDLSFSSSL